MTNPLTPANLDASIAYFESLQCQKRKWGLLPPKEELTAIAAMRELLEQERAKERIRKRKRTGP